MNFLVSHLCHEFDDLLGVNVTHGNQFPEFFRSFWCHECTVMLKNHCWRVSHFCSCYA